MKKYLMIIMTVLLCLVCSITAYGAQADASSEPETTQDASQPRLMVTSYKVEGDSLSPEKDSELEITIKNYSSTKAVSNVKLSILDETGDIKPDGMGTQYVEKIYVGSTYTWKIPLTVSKTAETGEHILTLTMEYEDKYYSDYSSEDTISINVKQTVGIDYDSLILPEKVSQGDTETISPNVMNIGKSTVRNCKISFDIEGMENGGTLFIGEIPAGESKSGSANLRIGTDVLGEVNGTASITYEDEFGESYEETVALSTIIEEKIELPVTEEEKERNNTLWWLFILIGLAAGGALGFGIPTAIRSGKQRKEDEMRL